MKYIHLFKTNNMIVRNRRRYFVLVVLVILMILFILITEINLQDSNQPNLYFRIWKYLGLPSLTPPAVLLIPKGGIGNQLFEYACHYALAKKHALPLYIYLPSAVRTQLNLITDKPATQFSPPPPFRELNVSDRSVALDAFRVPLFSWNTIDERYLVPSHTEIRDSDILTGNYSVNGAVLSAKDYCQSEAYFFQYRKEIREIFKFAKFFRRRFLSQRAITWDKIISRKGTIPVGVHIRRGDFIELNATIPISYYSTALDGLVKKLGKLQDISLFIFSDDLNYVTERFIPILKVFSNFDVSIVSDPTSLTSLEEFYLLTRCKHFVIPTSTFAWWAAYLGGEKKDKIVYAAHLREGFIKQIYKPDAQIFYAWQYKNIYYPSGWNVIEPNWAEMDDYQ